MRAIIITAILAGLYLFTPADRRPIITTSGAILEARIATARAAFDAKECAIPTWHDYITQDNLWHSRKTK